MLNKLRNLIKNQHEMITMFSMLIYMMTLGIMLHKGLFYLGGQIMFKRTYIAKIDTPSYSQFQTKYFLEEFNTMGDNKVISFEKIKYGRPVYIEEISEETQKLYPHIFGMTFPNITSCKIYMKKGLDLIDYRETLYHEYLHCMGFDHVIDRNDLMYARLYPIDKEQNIKYYAKKLKEKFYE